MSNSKNRQRKIREEERSQRMDPKKKFLIQAGFILALMAAILIITSNQGDKIKKDNVEQSTSIPFVKQGELTFTGSESEYKSKIDIEIADDDSKRSAGLMYRNLLGENQGMLFIFPLERIQSFWMRHTIIPLDMIFVNKSNEIIKIHRNTTPYAESSYSSGKPAMYVVEVNAGYTEKYNIVEGDRILWRPE